VQPEDFSAVRSPLMSVFSPAADHPERDSDDPESKRDRSGGTENGQRSRATTAVAGSGSCALFRAP
jgi:hypothetical protein